MGLEAVTFDGSRILLQLWTDIVGWTALSEINQEIWNEFAKKENLKETLDAANSLHSLFGWGHLLR